MNIERILEEHPDLYCRRIDLLIGEKEFWGRGIGTCVIRLLTEFGFESQDADAIFGCDVADYNTRSRRAFQTAGFEIYSIQKQDPRSKANCCCDLVFRKEKCRQNHT